MGAELFPYLPVSFITWIDYNTFERIPEICCPILVIHSKKDKLIPFSHGRKLYEEANEPKEFLEISGGHNMGFLESGEVYVNGLDSFILKHIDGAKK